ncbi:MAG: hypothetical protein PPP56_00795 [Longimonas sp.]|uniref:hypothetical protein n=1 Tax=Longimonas sp. TaxID=2039626 RepID=UPI00335F407B
MLTPHRFHADKSVPARLGVLVLIASMLLVGPLGGWQAVVGYIATGIASPCAHHSQGPHVCPHHAAMQAARAAGSGATAQHDAHHSNAHTGDAAHFCIDRDAMPPEMHEAGHDIPLALQCTCDHDADGPDDAVLVLDKFVLTALEQPDRFWHVRAEYGLWSMHLSSLQSEDIFHPPRV